LMAVLLLLQGLSMSLRSVLVLAGNAPTATPDQGLDREL